MPVVTLIEFPGIGQPHYEAASAQLADAGPPAGVFYHSCGPVPGGWRIVEVWESPEAFAEFADGRLIPAMIAQGSPGPTRREVMSTHHTGAVRRAD